MADKRWFVVDRDWHESGSKPPIECESREHAEAVLAFSADGDTASEMIRISTGPWREQACKYLLSLDWCDQGSDGSEVSDLFLRYLGLTWVGR